MFSFFGVGGEEDILENTDDISIENKFVGNIGQVCLDVIETDDKIIILAPIAGICLDDIDIRLDKSILTISGERLKPDNIYGDENNPIIRNSECFWGKFQRDIILPENLDFDSINAVMENNLLVLQISKFKFNAKEVKIDKIENN